MPTSWSGGNNPIPGWAGNPTGAPLTDAQKKRKMDLLSGGRSGGGDMPAPIPALGGAQTPVPPVRMEQPRGTQQPSNILMLARADQRAAGKYNFLPWECTGDGQARMQTSFAPSLLNGGKLMVEITNSAGNNTQSANTVYAGPTSGGAASPNFRALVTADIPNLGITAGKLATGSVYEDAIQDASVTTAKLDTGAVTPAKLDVTVPQVGRNRIINGNFNFWQRGIDFNPIAIFQYHTDRWNYVNTSGAVHRIQRSTDVPTVAQSGVNSNYSLLVDCTTLDASIGSSELCIIQTKVEGFNFCALYQQTFTLSFWVKATKTGIYCVGFVNSGSDRSYVAEYTINSSNTWEKKTITVSAVPSGGTWNFTNGIGLSIGFCLCGGSTWQTTANAWQNGGYFATSNQVNGVDSTSNDFRLAQVQLELGDTATRFEIVDQAMELLWCQRYFEKSFLIDTQPADSAENVNYIGAALSAADLYVQRVFYKAQKRNTTSVMTYYRPAVAGIAGVWASYVAGAWNPGASMATTQNDSGGFAASIVDAGTFAIAAGYLAAGSWTADAEL